MQAPAQSIHAAADSSPATNEDAAERLIRGRLALVLRATRVGLWMNELPLDQLSWDERVRELFWVPAGVEPTMALFNERLHPDDRVATALAVETALRDGTLFDAEYRVVNPETGAIRWIAATGQTSRDPDSQVACFDGICYDITARKQTEADTRLLAMLSERIRISDDADVLLGELVQIIAQHMQISRCYISEINEPAGYTTIAHEYHTTTRSLLGTYPLTAYPPTMLRLMRAGSLLISSDASIDPQTASIYQQAYAPVGARAHVIVPFLRNGRWVANLAVIHDTVREWQPSEVALLETLAERIWLAIERLRTEAEQRQYTTRLQYLNAASLAINAAPTQEALLREIVAAARDLLGATSAHVVLAAHDHEQLSGVVSPTDRTSTVDRSLQDATISAPLRDGDGGLLGSIELIGTQVATFTGTDAALFQQLAQVAAIALENQLLYTQEQAARLQAEEANQMRDAFLATVSHELRTPLTAMLGYAQLLQSRKRDDAYIARTLAKIERSARDQALLIEDLLDVSRVVSGKLRITPTLIDLRAVVQAAIDTVRPAVEAKNLHLQIALDEKASAVIGDANRLQQVVWNLLANAAKFTPAGGTIIVQLVRAGESAELSVADTGQGISAAFLPFVFERFRQADSTSQRAHSGLGLGLALVRHLIELHGGTVHATSAGESQGATFTVCLPLAQLAAARATRVVVSAKPAITTPAELHNVRVLVVDDHPAILDLLDEVLVAAGATVYQCDNAREALAILARWRPDVLLSDIAMPDEDGYWLIEQVRALAADAGGTTPAVALTAYVRETERTRVLQAGFQQYVPKPVEPATLRQVLAQVIARGSEAAA